MAATNIGVRSRYRLTPLARIATISLSAASRPSAMSTPSKKPIGMVRQRTLGSRCNKMLSVSANDADWRLRSSGQSVRISQQVQSEDIEAIGAVQVNRREGPYPQSRMNIAREHLVEKHARPVADRSDAQQDVLLESAKKECTYKGTCHPLVVSLANTQEPLFLVNRGGNRPSSERASERLDQAVDCVGEAASRK